MTKSVPVIRDSGKLTMESGFYDDGREIAIAKEGSRKAKVTVDHADCTDSIVKGDAPTA